MSDSISQILETPAVKEALAHLRANHDRMVEEIITLTEIPAPPFKEEVRAAAYEKMMAETGLEEVATDGIGNVTGIYRGTGNGNLVAVAAHLDTVFPEGTDVTVRREGTKLFAPGVGDDTRGLAVNLAIMRALKAAGVKTRADILFVGNVGEEGIGDLRGVRYLFEQNAYGPKIESFFTVDGLETEDLTGEAVGSYRYRVTFKGPGGHSYGQFGTVNPANALAEFGAGMARLEVPSQPKTTFNLSILGGGTSINAIPEEVFVDIDLRSVSQAELDRLDTTMKRLMAEAVAAENARNNTRFGEISATLTQLGNRPAGKTAEDARIVAETTAAVTAFGFAPSWSPSSTDANIPISRGIPAIKIGSGGTGGRAHSLDEWIDTEPELSLRGMSAVLVSVLAAAGLAE
ncbi:M20/M25/M40 family metallo-hydrolase [Maritimibacter alkaliphilus]|uniref:M20/M25/M40 family metallo-hydrolase n=1 Tax=Maritimibacter alkaliphilus TaxID=404236 RepID=UPI001C97CD54|nr:M20/M25/M40 family metallo-hydrolase [Maritimibacter alkaliphilus]MBY6089617.1 M20/M25/M40 family metallo-hydrolase [Maritimibacter alkaliphilus]